MFNSLRKKNADHALMAAFADGDRRAAQQLTEQLMPKIYGHAYYRLGNTSDAEDVTQEAFLKLWKVAPISSSNKERRISIDGRILCM